MMGRAMKPRLFTERVPRTWSQLQEDSHLPRAQGEIREAIRRGLIRVVPGEGGRVKILPLAVPGRARMPDSG